jgi:uncharacterized membrane protein
VFDDLLTALTLLIALGCAIVGGTFYAFSSFIMRGLDHIPPAQGIAAMQSINVTVFSPWFMVPFIGTALASFLLAAGALIRWGEPGAIFQLTGAVLYIAGSFGVTIALNVPRNNALMAVEATSAAGAVVWADYVSTWTAWNTVRTVASLAALMALVLALVTSKGG